MKKNQEKIANISLFFELSKNNEIGSLHLLTSKFRQWRKCLADCEFYM